MLSSRKQDPSNWKTYEAMDETIRRNAPDIALALRKSESTVNKWRECPWTAEDQDQPGRLNPLDLLEGVISTIEKTDPERAYIPIRWLNARYHFLPPVKMPAMDATETEEELVRALLDWTREIGETSTAISEALRGGRISHQDYKKCYREFLEDVEAALVLLAKMKARVE